MSEEVTYATLKFSNPKTKEPQESHSLKRTDSHETPDLELGGEAETEAGSIKGTAEVTESRAMKGHSAPSKVWYPIAFVSLSLNLVVLAGLGALGLMHYYKLIFNSKTVYDVQLNVTDHMETTTLPTDMPTTVSVASVVSDSVRPHRRQPTSLPSPWVSPDCPYSDPALHLCSEIWIQYGSNFYNFSTKIICNTCDSDCEKNHSSLMNMDDGENRNRTKLFLRCRPLYIFQTLLNSVSNNTNQTERNVSDISILTLVMYGCESWTVKKAECRRTFELWCWTGLLRVPWTAKRSNQSLLKEISPGRSLEGLMLKLKLQYFGHLM